MDNNKTQDLHVLSDKPEYVDVIKESELALSLFSMPGNLLVVCGSKDCGPDNLNFKTTGDCPYSRVMILFTCLPIKLEIVSKWKQRVFAKNIPVMKIDFLRIGKFDKEYIEGRIRRHCKNWDQKIPEKEKTALKKGQLVELPTGSMSKDSPDLLTAMFGTMGEMIMRVRYIHKRFKDALQISLNQNSDENVDKCIAEHKGRIKTNVSDGSMDIEDVESKLVSFPKLLLYGETGVGKTLVSRFLQSPSNSDNKNTERPVRISIPEYVGKEEDFEYALFGYVRGAYTGALQSGSEGLLVENMGRVVFLDEIEEANPVIQAKLLAYLDDYRVRPRGWLHKSFFCPTLIVAATNCTVEELKSRGFRKDLLARFTDIETIPPLRERKESMDFIIDTLLQQESINHGQKVVEIGKYALDRLKNHPYPRNFRELEDVLRNACAAAQMEKRNYLCECDIKFD